jgi:hypothetical protein
MPDGPFAAAACIFFARLHAAFGILAMLTEIAWLTCHSGSRMVLSHFDWHRGGGYPPAPATPPCIRVRTRRFELVTLTLLD